MRWGIIWCILCLVTLGCNNSSDSSFELTDRPWIKASEFEDNPKLHAKPNQVVIFNTEDKLSIGSKTSKSVHRIPYYVSEEAYFNIRLDTNQPCISEIKAVSATGSTAMDINLENPSARVHLTEGRYLFTVVRITPISEHCTVFFMHHPMTNEKAREKLSFKVASGELMTGLFDKGIYRMFGQLNSNKTAYQVFGIDQFVLNKNYREQFNSLRLNSNYLGAPISFLLQGYNESYSPHLLQSLYYDSAQDKGNGSWMITGSGTSDSMALSCMLAPVNCDAPVNSNDHGYLCHVDNVKQSLFPYKDQRPILAFATFDKMLASGCYYYDNTNSGYYRFALDYWDPATKNPRDLAFGIYNSLCPANTAQCDWQFRSIESPESLQYALNPYADSLLGAVSLTSRIAPGYDKIRLTELYRYYPDVSKLRDVNGNYLINEGEVALFSGTNYSGEAYVLNADTNYLLVAIQFIFASNNYYVQSVILSDNTASITFPDGQTIGKSNPNTASMNLDPNGSNGRIGMKVFRAIEVIFSNDCPSCNLAEVEISGSNFKGRNFSGANFTKAKITGSFFDKAYLAGADFTSAIMTGNSYISTNLTDAVMQGANFSNSNFKSANLCRARLNMINSLSTPTTLEGSYLQNANLSYADLSGASMKNVSFHSTSQGITCSPNTSCEIGACASAYKATMTGADFTNAYLSGTSFASTTLAKSIFKNAIALSVNFTGAVFTNDYAGSRTDFTGAVLYGADFTSSTVHGVNFQSAYWDDPSVAYLARTGISYLGSQYTNFPGSKYTSTFVCPQFAVNKKAIIPENTDATVICPNGNVGPCSSKDWALSNLPPASLIIISNSTPYGVPAGCNGQTDLFW